MADNKIYVIHHKGWLGRVKDGGYHFLTVRVDYFGHFMVIRGESFDKRHVRSFTSLRLMAVHLEVACSIREGELAGICSGFFERTKWSLGLL